MHMSDFSLKRANAMLYFAHILSHGIDCAADMAKVLQNDVVHLGHDIRLSYLPIIVNYGSRPFLGNGPNSGNSHMKKRNLRSKFRTEAEERKFWETHDSTDYIDWSKAERVRFPNLKPSTTAISIRLPLGLLEQIKIAANKRDVPYQSLIKMWLAEKVE
jgi:predicted DNA binding CopG/RHH family protein